MSIAISVDGVGKRFRVPLDRSSTLKHRLTHWRSSSRYREFQALRDVTFEIPAGEFTGIIGHNGSGKSTLLKILSRIYQPDAGRVRVNGRVSPFLELGVGFNPELDAHENIFLNGAILGLSRAQLRRKVDEILDFAGDEVRSQAGQKLKNFSSGMQVRLAFAVAIQAEADILLMDEVLAVGDAAFQRKCFEVFARYKAEGKTVVLVTHEINAVNLYCDRALMLDHGRLVSDGPAGEVTAQYARAIHSIDETADAGGGAPADRWGSREVVIDGVRLTDAGGVSRRNLGTGDPVWLELDYTVRDEAVTDFGVLLRVMRSDGLQMFQPTTYVNHPLASGPSRGGRRSGTVRFDIPALPLLDGTYTLTAEVGSRHGNIPYDHLDKVIRFVVFDELSRIGLLDSGGSWTVVTQGATTEPVSPAAS